MVCVSLVELQERDARMFAGETTAPVASGRGAAMRYPTKELVQLVWKVAQALPELKTRSTLCAMCRPS